MKVTPLKKQSKKNQRKFHAAKRGSWNGVSPITRVVQSKRIYDRNRTKQESRQSGDRWQNRADRTKFHKSHNIFFGCTAATSSMKQQAPKTLPQKAETIENTRKTADILIGAACHLNELRFSNNFVEKRSSSFLKALKNQRFFFLTILRISIKTSKSQN